MMEQLAFLLRVQNVPVLNLGTETCNTDVSCFLHANTRLLLSILFQSIIRNHHDIWYETL